MANETHNGWTNRETWALMLWINNDESFTEEFREAAALGREAVKERAETLFTVSGFRDAFGIDFPQMLAEIAGEIGSLWRINWEEVTDALLED